MSRAKAKSGRLLTGAILLLLTFLPLTFMLAQGARAEVVSASPRSQAPAISQLESAYKEHSMIRNQIAAQLNWLWREERFLKDDYQYSGEKGDIVTNTQVARELLHVRQQIDQLRQALASENQIIQTIGNRIPD